MSDRVFIQFVCQLINIMAYGNLNGGLPEVCLYGLFKY